MPSIVAPGRTPLILALDTSSSLGSVALARGSEILGQDAFEANPGHSTRLLPAIDALFRVARVAATEVELFAAVVGPGSFTGLRVSLACVRGLALGKPCFGAVATDVAAFAARDQATQTLALTDLFHGEVFASVHDRNGRRISDREAGDLTAVLSKVAALLQDDVALVGSATLRHREALAEALPSARFVELPEGLAPHLARLAASDAKGDNTVAAADLLPFYLRDPMTRGLLDQGRTMG